jgi:putative nucleotidyltransferase with HDIG domain
MKIETAFLRSKLGRRMFWLFALCALSPVALLAGISLRNVTNELRAQNVQELRRLSHEEGIRICERLLFLDAELKLAATSMTASISPDRMLRDFSSDFTHRFEGVELISADGGHRPLFGAVSAHFELGAEELAHLRSGKSMLSVRSCDGGSLCVFLVRQVDPQRPQDGFLLGEVVPSFLLDTNDVPVGRGLCLLGPQERTLLCSGETPDSFSSGIPGAVSGRFASTAGGKTYVSDYWKVFVKPTFLLDHVTVVASEPRSVVYLPLARFERNFVLALVLALSVVLFLTSSQIRRSLIPLGKLREGTQRIADGDFRARVGIESRDEFHELAQSFNSMATRIEQQFNTLKTSNAIDRAILSAWNLEQIVETLLGHLHSVLPYELASVSIVGPGPKVQLRNYVASSTPGQETSVSSGVLAAEDCRALGDGKVKTFSARGIYPPFLTPLVSRGMSSLLVAPIVVAGRLSAVIALGQREDSTRSEEERMRARQLADQVGVALSNARLVADLRELNIGTLAALARAIDAKSPWTAGHSERVTSMALEIGREMGLSQAALDIINRGGLLHDIGKIGVPAAILDKPSRLTPEEMAQVRAHVEIGGRILEPIPGLQECMPIVLEHHEWINGGGYPRGLKGDEISLNSRIVAVADCYDALVSERPYRGGMPLDRVLKILQEGTGKQFDPEVMSAFLRVIARKQGSQSNEIVAVPVPAT